MIDYFALGLGHGLIAIALLRLFVWNSVDFDPLIGTIQDKMRRNRMESSTAGRNAKRRADAAAAKAARRRRKDGPKPTRPRG